MRSVPRLKSNSLPSFFKPLLWSLRWSAINKDEDKEDIIINAINEGTLRHWRWIIATYGKDTVRRVLQKRLATEFHPESRNLAKIVFSVPRFRHARRSSH